jgi:WD40 repeat protein
MTDQEDKDKFSAQANDSSIAIGKLEIGGDVSGNIHIGNVYQTSEDDLPLFSDEIENGLTRFAQYLPERAPVLRDSFSSIARKLRATLGADQNSLSPALKSQREDGVNRMKLMCMEVTDISFRAICLGQNPPPYDSRPPFLGLFAFRPEDREFFFGRDELVQKLVARINAHPFLAVLGASGSGKSSLVMAGLVPALEAQMSYLTPSSAPLSQLLAAKESASAKTVFVIDQFEELFTHPHDSTERADFIHALLELTKTNRVVITMRADFWGEVAIYSDLKQTMQEHQELIAPMNVDELHSAMEKQAAVVGLRFDPTLSESILAEVKGEPGAMPLLQHALWELWNRRHGLWIKVEEYQAFGGVKQAIASTAEEVYASCSDFERARVQDIFLRLTRLDESGEGRDTRRRVLIEELIPVNSDSSVTINLLNKLADSRLIVKTDKDVEVAHEALIRHWGRLTEWLNEDRNNLRLREGVSESAREWENSKRDDSLLNHRGGRLELALAMSKLPRYQLNPIEQAYLNACVALRNKEQRERERRLRYTLIASIAAAVIFLILGSFGWVKSNLATTAQAKAETQASIALARQLAAQAQPLLLERDNQQITAVLMAIQSLSIFPSGDAAKILQNNPLALPINSITHNDWVYSIAISPNSKFVASGSNDDTAIVWDVTTGKEVSHMNHTDNILSVVFSPNSKYVATGSRDGSARVWDASTGQEISHMIHGEIANSVSFSPDGRYIVSTGCDRWGNDGSCVQGSARTWEANSGVEISRVEHQNGVVTASFSPDGKNVVSGGLDNTARVWDAFTGKEISQIAHNDSVWSVAFSPDGKYVISGSHDNTARVWDAFTGKEISRMTHNDSVWSVAFSPNGKYVTSGGGDGTARVWNPNTGQEISRVTHNNFVYSVAFSPDNKYVVSASSDHTARVWDAITGRELARTIHDGIVTSAKFSPNGEFAVSASWDRTVRLWDFNEKKEISRITYNENVGTIIFSPDNKYVISGGWDNTAHVWDAISKKEVASIMHDGDVHSVAFSPDSKYVASEGCEKLTILFLCYQSSVRVWEASTGKEIIRITVRGDVYSLAFSPNRKDIVTGGSENTVRIWEIASGREINHMTHDDSVNSVTFSPAGDYVASGSNDNSIRVWKVSTGKEIAKMILSDNVRSVAFSADGKYIVSGSDDNTVRIWDINTGKEIIHMTHGDSVVSVAFSLNNKYVISGSKDKTARVWVVDTGQEIARMLHGDLVRHVAFSFDGKFAISDGCNEIITNQGCTQGSIRTWIYRPEDLIADACSRVTRNLTRAEWDQYIGDALPYQAVCPNLPIEPESMPTP